MLSYKKYAIISVVIYLTVISGLAIGLIINFNEKTRVDKTEKPQFNTTYFIIIGYDTYSGLCEVCQSLEDCLKTPGFYAYAYLKYLAWFNNTLSVYKSIDYDYECNVYRDVILDFIENKYPLNSQFLAYYNKSNPADWRKHLPEYIFYERNLLGLLVFIFIILVLMIFHGIFFTMWYCKNKNEIIYESIRDL